MGPRVPAPVIDATAPHVDIGVQDCERRVLTVRAERLRATVAMSATASTTTSLPANVSLPPITRIEEDWQMDHPPAVMEPVAESAMSPSTKEEPADESETS